MERLSDVNFSDVFGGPPRRSSMYEMRQLYSYADSGGALDEDEAGRYPGSLSVFGGDGANRWRTGNDFFSDIFKSSGSKQQDPFSSAEPSQFSLPTFGPPTRSSTRSKDPNQEKGGHLNDGLKVSTDASQFHFSIYKWASKGVPLMGSNSFRPKETGKTSVSSSSKLSMSRSSSISSMENDTHGRSESSQMVVEKVISLSESTTLGTGRVDNVSADTVLKMKHDSHLKVGSGGKEALNPLKSRHLTVTAGESKGVNESNKKASAEKSETVKKPNALTGTMVGKAGQAKVKEFANQKESSKLKTAVDSQSQSSSWKAIFRPQKEANPKLQFNLNMEKSLQHESITEPKKVEACLKQSDKSYSASKTKNHIPSSNSSKTKNTSVSTTVPDVSKTSVRDGDESSQPNFVMREVLLEKNEKPQPGKDHEDMQAADAKIRKWSNGKEGNIRSLLSTLQYVLWAESGWKPVPLVDIIEGNAVKRAYQRALLRLHPDKLQQMGAASHQKYIAEKVFDILQEAWTQFNSL